MAYFARLTRGTMLETLQADYIRTAKAKGLRWRRIVVVHTLRNSLIPVVTAAGPILGFLITGSFIIEYIFAIPGIGSHFVQGALARDYPLAMGVVLLYTIVLGLANIAVDLAILALDPRARGTR